MTSIARPCVLRDGAASSARTCGRDVVGGPVREPAGDVGALADDPAALGAPFGGLRLAVADQQHELVERGRRGVAVLAIDGLGLEGALDDAAAGQLGGEGRVAAQPSAIGASHTAMDGTSRPTSRRIAGRGETPRRLAVELVRSPPATTRTRLTWTSPGAARAVA
jgi:hypothetical protein